MSFENVFCQEAAEGEDGGSKYRLLYVHTSIQDELESRSEDTDEMELVEDTEYVSACLILLCPRSSVHCQRITCFACLQDFWLTKTSHICSKGSSNRNCPKCFSTGPIDQGGTRHGGSAAWISRTSVFVWSDLENRGELQVVIRALLAGGVRELSNTWEVHGLVE